MEISENFLNKLKSLLEPSQLASILAALREDPDNSLDWRIEGKNNLEDPWILLATSKTESAAAEAFEKTKSWGGGFYRLLNPRGIEIITHPVDLWALDEKLAPLDIKAPSDWDEYDTYLLDGGMLEYEGWKLKPGSES